MKIEVTQKNIDESRVILKNNIMEIARFCPIALAAKNFGENVIIGLNVAHIDNIMYKLPPEACDFIENFNRVVVADYITKAEFIIPDLNKIEGKDVEPITFNL